MATLPTLSFVSQMDPTARVEMEQFVSLLHGYLLEEHTEGGGHGALTADSITVDGPVTITGGPVTIDGVPIGPGGGGDGELQYLGPYAPPRVYNDGDIVIGPDGIAYMCVVDGTTTPLEPWPGVGMGAATGPPGPPGPQGPPGTNAAIVADATYWTVSPHPTLVNERALNTLANGYVKSIYGEPNIVPIIPLTEGGTGATTPADARTNLGLGTMAVQNANAVAITGGSITGPTAISVSVNINTTGGVGAGYFVGDGSNLTALNASQLATGMVPTARLGSGVANSGTVLYGDQVYRPISAAGGIESGLIVISLTPCPPGYTRVVLDGYFLRVGPTPGVTGGTWDHVHGPGSFASQNHQHGPGNYHANRHAHNGNVSITINGTTGGGGGHDHGYGGTISGSTGNDEGGINSADAGGSFTVPRTPHHHAFSANYGGRTDGVGNHDHPFNGSGSGPIGDDEPPVWGDSSPAGAQAIVGASDPAAHLPPHYDIFLCQKI